MARLAAQRNERVLIALMADLVALNALLLLADIAPNFVQLDTARAHANHHAVVQLSTAAPDALARAHDFGHVTNDIIYSRLAPGVMEELKNATPRAPDGRQKHQLRRRLTEDLGHPKLREHLASVITAMQSSDNYDDFIRKLDRVKPRFGDTLPLPLEAPKDKIEPL